MEFLTITYDDVKINVSFGIYGSTDEFPDGADFSRDEIGTIYKYSDEGYLLVKFKSGDKFPLCHDGLNANALKVDSVNSSTPASLDELQTLIAEMIV